VLLWIRCGGNLVIRGAVYVAADAGSPWRGVFASACRMLRSWNRLRSLVSEPPSSERAMHRLLEHRCDFMCLQMTQPYKARQAVLFVVHIAAIEKHRVKVRVVPLRVSRSVSFRSDDVRWTEMTAPLLPAVPSTRRALYTVPTLRGCGLFLPSSPMAETPRPLRVSSRWRQ
jgi:hypothetical protein